MEWRLPPILDLEKSCADVRKGDGAPTPPAIAPLLRDSQPTSSLYVVDFSVDGGQLFFGDVVCFLFLFEVICNKVSLEKCDIFTSDREIRIGCATSDMVCASLADRKNSQARILAIYSPTKLQHIATARL